MPKYLLGQRVKKSGWIENFIGLLLVLFPSYQNGNRLVMEKFDNAGMLHYFERFFEITEYHSVSTAFEKEW